MTTRKRNEWLDTALSDDDEDDRGYESDEQQESRGAVAARSQKRRKVSQREDDETDDESVDEEESDQQLGAGRQTESQDEDPEAEGEETREEIDGEEAEAEEDGEGEEGEEDDEVLSAGPKKPKVKPLTARQIEKSQKAAKKTGVIYLSRIPPFMKPATLKHLLESYGEIGRVFLTPEDPTQHQRRVRAGGNKKKSFTDGWVEFKNKKNAKLVAETLNGNIIGGKKGSFYHDDVWNMKYLKGFKWHHLTDQIANENAERAARLRAEISKTRRENKKFVEDIERAKMLETMQARHKEKLAKTGEDGAQTASNNPPPNRGPKMQFKQNQVKLKQAKDGAKTHQPEAVNRVLKSIF